MKCHEGKDIPDSPDKLSWPVGFAIKGFSNETIVVKSQDPTAFVIGLKVGVAQDWFIRGSNPIFICILYFDLNCMKQK